MIINVKDKEEEDIELILKVEYGIKIMIKHVHSPSSPPPTLVIKVFQSYKCSINEFDCLCSYISNMTW